MIVAGETISGTHPAIGMVFQGNRRSRGARWENVALPLEIAGVARASG